MSAERELERVVRSWLRDDGREDADRVLNTVLAEIDTTSQRRATWWPVRRTPTVNKFFGVAVAAAAIIVAAVIGYRLITNPTVGPPPVGTPEPTPEVTTLTPANVDHQLVGGQYRFTLGPGAEVDDPAFDIQLSLPREWMVQQVSDDEVSFWVEGQGSAYIGFFTVQRVYKDPCHSERGFAGDHTGSITSEDLVSELRGLRRFSAGPVNETTIAGLATTHFAIMNTIDAEALGCSGGNLLPLFATGDADLQAELEQRTDNSPATNGGSTEEIWVVDRGSHPLLIVTEPGDDAVANGVILQGILDSVALE